MPLLSPADPDEVPWNLLARHLAAEASATERAQLFEWLRTDPRHLQLLTTTTQVWERAGEPILPEPPLFSAADVEEAWQRFQPLLGPVAPATPTPAPPAPSPSAPSPPWWHPLAWPAAPAWRLAASGGLLASTVALLWLLLPGREPRPVPPPAARTYVSGEQRLRLRLPDSSTVWLNAHSQLTYAAGPFRQVQLMGEAFIQVHPAAQPLVLSTATGRVRIAGGEVNVRAYAAEDSLEVSVARGRAWLARRTGTDSVQLAAAQRAALYAADAPGQVPLAPRPNPLPDANYRAWQSDTLRFVDAPVPQVARTLHALFGTRLVLAGGSWAQCRFTGTFARPRPEQVLAVLRVATGATLQATAPGRYTLSGNTCRAASRKSSPPVQP